MPGSDFLALPARAVKPRATGITHVLDRGLPLRQTADLLAGHRVLASPGGTLLEIAWAQGRAAEFLDWARVSGFPCVEVSDGTVVMGDSAKRDLIEEAAQHFIVL